MNNKTNKMVGIVATAALATSMVAGAGSASAQTPDTLKASEPAKAKAAVQNAPTAYNVPITFAKKEYTMKKGQSNVVNNLVDLLGMSAKVQTPDGLRSLEYFVKYNVDAVDINKVGDYTVNFTLNHVDDDERYTFKGQGSAIVHVVESGKPTISFKNGKNITARVGDTFEPYKYVTAMDAEDGNITSNVKAFDTKAGKMLTVLNTEGTINVQFTVKDSDGNLTTETATLTVLPAKEVEDAAPVLNVPSNTTITEGDNFDVMSGVSATDKEDGNITSKVTYEGSVNTNKAGTYTIKYTVKDSAGHTVTKTRTVTVNAKPVEDAEPVLSVPAETTITEGDNFDPMAKVKALDKEDGDITSKVVVNGSVNTNKEGTYKIHYTVKDSAGHTVTKIQTVIVKAKPVVDEAPVLKVPAETTITEGDTFDPMTGVKATDKEDGDITSNVVVEGKVDADKAGTYTIKYTVKDSAGHVVTSEQKVTVKAKPVIEDEKPVLKVPTETTITVGDKFDPMTGVKATDKEDGDITSKVVVEGKVDAYKEGTYTIKYTVKDSKGHEVTATQKIVVKAKEEVKDEAPVLKVPSETTITVGDKFDPFAGVSATDKEDGDLTDRVDFEGEVNTEKAGTYTLEYSVRDSKGNRVTAKRTVIVKAKEEVKDEKPVLKVPGETTITVGDKFDPMTGVTATDKEDGDLAAKVKVDGNVDTSKEGTYELTYTVKDSKGQEVTATQKVTVKAKEEVKNEKPVLTVPETVELTVGDVYNPMTGVKAVDKEDGDLTDKVMHFGEVDTNKEGTYEVKFLVRDAGGNEVLATQKVIVKAKEDNGNNGGNEGNNGGNEGNNGGNEGNNGGNEGNNGGNEG
ncbi:immunoglobulin-like domain-containing protein, partial [Bacillus cereus group sp. MYBK15-3]